MSIKLLFYRFLFALGIRHVGVETAKDLSNKFITFHGLWNYLLEEIKKEEKNENEKKLKVFENEKIENEINENEVKNVVETKKKGKGKKIKGEVPVSIGGELLTIKGMYTYTYMFRYSICRYVYVYIHVHIYIYVYMYLYIII
jgi:NAD-dependent DNA ligase